ncbi:MAG: L-tyrosine/L-tryptophan isonitrile synthase family protein [Candidatus Moranbacteria bacterium]|nr:L-tyrosine/L-tryptophan isonitrile synthase family protein [Candidatus Moranbacteria bacterium]
MDKNNLDNLLSISEACKLLNCHPNSLRLWEKKGLIKSIRFGIRRDRKYSKEMLLKLINKEENIEALVLPSNYDISRIDMTGTFYEKLSPEALEENSDKLTKETINKFDFKKFIKKFNTQISYFSEKDFSNCKTISEKVLRVITSQKYRNGSFETINLEKYGGYFLGKIEYWVERNEPIQFMLPAMPFKIANPLKSSRRDADLAEVGSFCKFNEINLQIKKFYKPGATFTIFHDGHLYYRHFLHTKEDVDRYFNSLKRFVKELGLSEVIHLKNAFDELKHIKNFKKIYEEARIEMDNLWKSEKYNNEKIQKIIQSAKQNVNLSDILFKVLYRINFMEDWDLTPDERKMKKEINERSEKCAFEYMVVQHALEKAEFFNAIVPNGIRLTVHPKEGQIGVFMVKKRTHLLPWMGAGVLKNNGEVSVHYESELLSSGKYHPVYLKGEKYPFYYKEAETIYKGSDEFKNLFDSIVNGLKKKDFYWAFAFNSEYFDIEIRNLLANVHKKLAEKSIEDKAICKEEALSLLKQAYEDNQNIQIKATEKEIPSGIIILKDRVINLLWGETPSAFEIKTPEVVDSYKKYFKELWSKSQK